MSGSTIISSMRCLGFNFDDVGGLRLQHVKASPLVLRLLDLPNAQVSVEQPVAVNIGCDFMRCSALIQLVVGTDLVTGCLLLALDR